MSRTVLVIDTATAAVTAGIARHGERTEVLAERIARGARAHAEQLTPNVLAALEESGLTMQDLQAVVVGCGPGPFTGLRVGMATAAAYGDALHLPVYGVCSLDGIGRVAGAAPGAEVLVVTDARRREVYWARYRGGERIDGPAVSAPDAVDVGAATAVAGSAEHAALFDLPVLDVPAPTVAGLIAAVSDWGAAPAPLRPLYLRRPDAKAAGDPAAQVRMDVVTSADAARCAELEAQLFGGDDPWPAAAFVRELAAPHTHYAAARLDDTLVGYAGISRLGRTAPFEYEIHTIGVDPEHRGRGIGRRLLDELLAFAGDDVIFLEVRTDNEPAIALYRSVGFQTVGVRRRYYRASGADAYTMRRDPAGTAGATP
ncbi:bifunctional tRNA (adenosine(37)-N6)-threonylcarbamoyltransferase complex dimerization subunit type 1 TsaB/ribosomal-protein-alanine acetyltransferase RimI [Mycolicibacillus koreensis]|nr:bifunctional tRNA (adenosine(37)-N6)-threonylcarbamoyltransferase complex dimerization subunit type 1 TsaB/ribosomal-protein-alanine acetyltransferase RimI [Mycolicibacillus koreensis]